MVTTTVAKLGMLPRKFKSRDPN